MWTLCLFAKCLASSLKPASAKVYLSAVRALHIEHGYSDPLVGCLRLQRIVKGIKCCKGSSADKRLPITPDILAAIYRCLDYSVYDDVLFWAACCLTYFGFLRSSEFTVPHGNAYTPVLHLSHEDVAFDRRVNPSSFQVTIKVSKTVPSRWDRGVPPCVQSNRCSTTWIFGAQLLGYSGRFRWSSVCSFQRRPFNPCGLHRAPASVVSTDWYSWSLWQSHFSYWGDDYSRFSGHP